MVKSHAFSLALRFFFVIAHAARTTFRIHFLDRPLVIAFFLGFCTDNMSFALSLALVLELFWIDTLRLGIVVPPSGTFSFLLLYPLCLHFQWYLPSLLPIPLIICIMFGFVSSWFERWQRKKNSCYNANLEAWVRQTTENPDVCDVQSEKLNTKQVLALSPSEIIFQSRWSMLWSSALLYVLCWSILYGFFKILQAFYIVPSISLFTWNLLYSIALLGAILSLRTSRTYAFLLLGFCFLFLWIFARSNFF